MLKLFKHYVQTVEISGALQSQGAGSDTIREPFKVTSDTQHALRTISETRKDHFMDAGYLDIHCRQTHIKS